MPAAEATNDWVEIYRSPGCRDYPLDETPELARDYDALLAHARAALARRQAAYPALIGKGEITAELAQDDLAGWADLVQEWSWIVTGPNSPEGCELPHPMTLRRRLAAVDLALERIEIERSRVPVTRRRELFHQQDLNLALRWHLTTLKYGTPAIHFWMGCTHALRRQLGIALCGVCERWSGEPQVKACTRTDCGLSGADRQAAA